MRDTGQTLGTRTATASFETSERGCQRKSTVYAPGRGGMIGNDVTSSEGSLLLFSPLLIALSRGCCYRLSAAKVIPKLTSTPTASRQPAQPGTGTSLEPAKKSVAGRVIWSPSSLCLFDLTYIVLFSVLAYGPAHPSCLATPCAWPSDRRACRLFFSSITLRSFEPVDW